MTDDMARVFAKMPPGREVTRDDVRNRIGVNKISESRVKAALYGLIRDGFITSEEHKSTRLSIYRRPE